MDLSSILGKFTNERRFRSTTQMDEVSNDISLLDCFTCFASSLSERTKRGLASRYSNACLLQQRWGDSTEHGRRQNTVGDDAPLCLYGNLAAVVCHVAGRTLSVMMRRLGWKHAVALALCPG